MGRWEEGGMDGGRGSERDSEGMDGRWGGTEGGRKARVGRRMKGGRGEGASGEGGMRRMAGGRKAGSGEGVREGEGGRGGEVNITPTHLQGLHNYYVDIFQLLYRPSCLLI